MLESKSSSFCKREDCQGSFTMTIHCRRSYSLAVMPLLIAFCLVGNLSLFRRSERVLEQQRAISDSFGNATHAIVPSKTALDRIKKQVDRNEISVKKKKRAPRVRPSSLALSSKATFAACLLIKDDNEILSEWIAYHYHTLKLRRLIVAVDPLSKESPRKILQQWSNLTDLNVIVWSDDDFMPEYFLAERKPPPEHMQVKSVFVSQLDENDLMEVSIHRYRQRVFLSQCMRHLRDTGSTWVVHIDTDEYVTPSKMLREMKPYYLNIPTMDQAGAVLNLLQQTVRKTSKLVKYPCISLLRVLYGAVESTQAEVTNQVPPGFDPVQFETLRWRYHAQPGNMSLHGEAKVILDVAAIPDEYFPKELASSIHNPVKEYCAKKKDLVYDRYRAQPLAANHYLGSWKRYNGRQDKRRSRASYEAKAFWQHEVDDGVRPWLKGFVNTMGKDLATKLLGNRYLSENGPAIASQ